MTDNSHIELVSAFQKGSREAFAKLVSSFQNMATSVAFSRTGDLQRSEDIAQQAFLVAWQKQSELEHPERFGAWLRGITNNLALNEVRLKANRQRRRTNSLDVDAHPVFEASVDSETIQSEQNELLWSTLQSIPELYREPIILFYREGQSVASVAQQLGLSNDTVKQRLSRGRAMMKKEIEELVEKMLFETRPQEAFCASVMSVLPAAIGTKVAAAAATKAGSVAASKSLVAKVSVGAVTGASAGLLGALFGLVGGIGGAWLGVRQGIKHATSQEEKELHYWFFGASVLSSAVYTMAVLYLVMLSPKSAFFTIGLVVTNVGFLLTLLGMIAIFTVRQSRLHKTYGKPEYCQSQSKNLKQPSALGLRANSLAALFGAWAWLLIMTLILGAGVLFSAALTAFSLLGCYAWIKAPMQKNILEHTRLAANLCLWSTWIEGVIIAAGYFLNSYGQIRAFNNVPFWLIAIGVVLLGSLLSVWLRFIGKKQHEAMVISKEK